MNDLLTRLRSQAPLIHCITNPISINQCANGLLAVGARPIMAEHPSEVQEITASAQALLLNLGNITEARMESIPLSAAAAQNWKIPFLLDAVGIACSKLRRDFLLELLTQVTPTVIKGNYSEILALYREDYHASGVDADRSLSQQQTEQAAAALARYYGTVILASGKTDIVTDGSRVVRITGGTPRLASVTGTGCMLGALCTAFLAVEPAMDAAIAACAALGICGEKASTAQGNGSFLVALMDALSQITDGDIVKQIKLEELTLEEI